MDDPQLKVPLTGGLRVRALVMSAPRVKVGMKNSPRDAATTVR